MTRSGAGTAGTKGVPRADREEQILAAATEVFGSQGFAAASVVDVASRAGISKPMVYHYFGSKEGLLDACLHRAGGLLLGEIERVAGSGLVGLERGLATLEAIFEVLEDRPWVWRLLFDPTVPRAVDGVAAALADYTERITVLAHEGVAEMMAVAGNTDAADISAMTAVWVGLVDSLVAWWLDHPGESAAQMTERCVRLMGVAFAQ
ncbi:TetR/AcrR family transcriptional regulator [Nocardioides sp.]|jgi:AcrR family transcriptional regulator|uniref:TetR/AcrR family transcriptional regulator n=1 Tax=Nocardioides sp. TaxID=35761 RepID=UPI002608678B|nr:TetR/AcrR family transcriptional regulator [Nocardioides sp.]